MDPKALLALRKVLTVRTKHSEIAKEVSIAKPAVLTFQREKKFLTYLVGSLDVRRESFSRLTNMINSVISPRGPFPIIPTHERYDFDSVVVWVNTNSIESLENYDRLSSCIASLCEKVSIPYIVDVERVKDYDVCASPI